MQTPSPLSAARAAMRQYARLLRVAALAVVAGAALPACSEAKAAAGETLESRISALESKEEIRATLHAFAQVVDSSDPAALSGLSPAIHANFTLDAVDFEGHRLHFEGLDGLINGFGPIMLDADANLAPSDIDVKLDGDTAYAKFKFINSVKPPPQLNLDVDVKVLLLAANTATFVREDGAWKLISIELIHSLAYPGTIESGEGGQ